MFVIIASMFAAIVITIGAVCILKKGSKFCKKKYRSKTPLIVSFYINLIYSGELITLISLVNLACNETRVSFYYIYNLNVSRLPIKSLISVQKTQDTTTVVYQN